MQCSSEEVADNAPNCCNFCTTLPESLCGCIDFRGAKWCTQLLSLVTADLDRAASGSRAHQAATQRFPIYCPHQSVENDGHRLCVDLISPGQELSYVNCTLHLHLLSTQWYLYPVCTLRPLCLGLARTVCIRHI